MNLISSLPWVNIRWNQQLKQTMYSTNIHEPTIHSRHFVNQQPKHSPHSNTIHRQIIMVSSKNYVGDSLSRNVFRRSKYRFNNANFVYPRIDNIRKDINETNHRDVFRNNISELRQEKEKQRRNFLNKFVNAHSIHLIMNNAHPKMMIHGRIPHFVHSSRRNVTLINPFVHHVFSQNLPSKSNSINSTHNKTLIRRNKIQLFRPRETVPKTIIRNKKNKFYQFFGMKPADNNHHRYQQRMKAIYRNTNGKTSTSVHANVNLYMKQ